MRPLRYSINVTLDGCCDHRAMHQENPRRRRLEIYSTLRSDYQSTTRDAAQQGAEADLQQRVPIGVW